MCVCGCLDTAAVPPRDAFVFLVMGNRVRLEAGSTEVFERSMSALGFQLCWKDKELPGGLIEYAYLLPLAASGD
jgi:hypothetical protein